MSLDGGTFVGQVPFMATERQRQVLIERNTTHGLSRKMPTTYRTWKDARARCRNPRNVDYHRYGGRGITFDQRWDDFAVFVADLGERPRGMTLERLNRDGNYEPGNCTWADIFTQANNRSNNHPITAFGETKNLQAWCDQFGLEQSKVRYRLKVGYTPEQALSSGDFRRG